MGLPGIKESSPEPADSRFLCPEPPEVGDVKATGKLKSRPSPITFKTDRVDVSLLVPSRDTCMKRWDR